MSKRYTALFLTLFSLFVLLFILLCYYSRLATDDYYFIWDVRNHGILYNVKREYMAWCGRFSSNFLMDVFYKMFDVRQQWYFVFPLVSYALLITGIYHLCGAISSSFKIPLNRSGQLLLAFSFTTLLFFMSVDIGETWIWYCSLSSYLWSVIAFVWGFFFLISITNRFISIALSILCFIYVGGASEVYSVIYGVLILLFLLHRFKKAGNFKIFIHEPLNSKILFIYLIFGISFLVFLIAPGNYLRDQLFPPHQFSKAILITGKSIIKFGILYLPFRLIYILAFAVPFAVAGNAFNSLKNDSFPTLRNFFIRSTFILALLLLLFFFLVAYVMIETGPPRLWFMVAFLLSVYCCALSFFAGFSGYLNQNHLKILKPASLFLGTLIIGYNLIHQYPIITKYAKADDERISFIIQANKLIKKDSVIQLTPLPSSGMLYSGEIKADTNHFTNRELKLGYDLKFYVVSGK